MVSLGGQGIGRTRLKEQKLQEILRNRSKDRSLVMETRYKDDHQRTYDTDVTFNNKVSSKVTVGSCSPCPPPAFFCG